MNKTITFLLLIFTFTLSIQSKSQTKVKRGDYRIMFYNCENFFDIENDPVKRDDDFTPDGIKHWNYKKYQEKLMHISQVIAAVSAGKPADLVGLCEVENQKVLEDLTQKSPLKVFGYKIIHYESPDHRGIDVALLYQPATFKPIYTTKIPVIFKEKDSRPTRDILYVKGILTNGDTLNVFVNHWPSRWGGMLETEGKRMFVAALLRTKVDSIMKKNPEAKIFIMGDLNDFPTNRSLLESLHALHDFDSIVPTELYNLSWYLQEVKHLFSHKFHGEQGILDQMIVSGTLLDTTSSLYTSKDNAHIFNADFLLEKDKYGPGKVPFRTYIGMKYHGGYSDHLPPYIDLFIKEKK